MSFLKTVSRRKTVGGCRFGCTIVSVIMTITILQPVCAWSEPQSQLRAQTTATTDGSPNALQKIKVVKLTIDGQRQRILFASPPRPWATIIMLPGGSGQIDIESNGDVRHGDNFVVRTRNLWLEQGVAVLIPDALDDQNLRGMRSSPAYRGVVGHLIAFARASSEAPVFLLGTSQGAIAAVNGAARVDGALAGLILSESVTQLGGSHETVFEADPQQVSAPVLIVANEDDTCDVAPPQDAAKIATSLSRSMAVKLLDVSGGLIRSSNPCGSMTPHGYFGIENMVIGEIISWMKAQAP